MNELRASAESYLETILMLHSQNMPVRSVDIARAKHVSQASVCVAIRNLKENGCISIASDSLISLLPKGRRIAAQILERQRVLTAILIALGIPEETASSDAGHMKHLISNESFSAIKKSAADAGLIPRDL